jgi:hypothetical protein
MTFFRKRKLLDPQNPFQLVRSYLAKGTFKILENKAREMGLPIPRLVAIAVDNELEKLKPFTLDTCSAFLPERQPCQEDVTKLGNYMMNFESGTGREMLMLCRRDIGILSRENFLYAYRDAMRSHVINEGKAPNKGHHQYRETYPWVRLTGITKEQLAARKKQIAEKFAELANDYEALESLLTK